MPATAGDYPTPEQQVDRLLKQVRDPWKFGVGAKVEVRLACLGRAQLRKALHYAFILKDIPRADATLRTARCYRVNLTGTVVVIGKKYGEYRIYGVQFANGGKAWTFGPDYIGKPTVDIHG